MSTLEGGGDIGCGGITCEAPLRYVRWNPSRGGDGWRVPLGAADAPSWGDRGFPLSKFCFSGALALVWNGIKSSLVSIRDRLSFNSDIPLA